jgi:GrpB-like predicted nucleotidyltransferase (UPF0157 family)
MSSIEENQLERAIHEKIEITEYNPEWPLKFNVERQRLQELLGDSLSEIEHVGSTSVPGLPAKPIIDIIAVVASMSAADAIVEHLCVNGYATSAEFNATLGDKRWLMRHQNGRRTHHLHLVLPGSEEYWSLIPGT